MSGPSVSQHPSSGGNVSSATAAVGQVPVADGAGGVLWSSPVAASGVTPVASMGDSIQFASTSITDRSAAKDQLAWVSLLTDGRAVPVVNAGVTGNTTAQMLARFDTSIPTGLGAKIIYIMGGTNDANASVSIASYAANMIAMIQKTLARGALPVICTVPPNPSTAITTVNGISTRRKLAAAYNVWIKSYCALNNIPVAETHAAVVDPTTGGYLAAYDSGDATHPTDAGSAAMAQAIATTLSPYLSQWHAPLPTFQTTDSPNLITNALFLTDANVDGKADGWTFAGTNAVWSLVTGDTAILGSAQRVTDAVNEGANMYQLIASGFSVGDKIAFTGRMKIAGNGPQQLARVKMLNASLANVASITPVAPTSPSNGWHSWYIEAIVPATVTQLQPMMATQSAAGADMQVAQMGLYNLTALGLP